MKKVVKFIAVSLIFLAFCCAGWLFLEKLAQDKVLSIISSAQPGHPISEVLGRFGKPYQQTDDVRDMGDGGAPVDHAFCNGKTLYQYYVSPPCRWVNIYTDRDGNIVFVNWSSS